MRRFVVLLPILAVVYSSAQQNPAVQDDENEPDNPAARWQWFAEQRSDSQGLLAGHMRLRAIRDMDRMIRMQALRKTAPGITATTGQWTFIGPQAINAGANAAS